MGYALSKHIPAAYMAYLWLYLPDWAQEQALGLWYS